MFPVFYSRHTFWDASTLKFKFEIDFQPNWIHSPNRFKSSAESNLVDSNANLLILLFSFHPFDWFLFWLPAQCAEFNLFINAGSILRDPFGIYLYIYVWFSSYSNEVGRMRFSGNKLLINRVEIDLNEDRNDRFALSFPSSKPPSWPLPSSLPLSLPLIKHLKTGDIHPPSRYSRIYLA